MEPILELLYLYGFPAIATILAVVLGIIWVVMPPTAKLLLMKKLGIAKGGKGYLMVAHDDRYMQTEPMDVYPEGAMEKKKKHGQSLTFYLAKPQDDTANQEANLANEERDKDMLTPYSLDGILPVHFAHISKAIATNPKVLTALRMANRIKEGSKRVIETEAKLPRMVETDGGTLTQAMPIQVLLPFDPVDIKKNFPAYWQQSNIDATKKRHQAIGFEKAKKEYKEYIWPLVIVGIVVIAGMVITGLAMHLF
jgi:hypothetical protein